MLPVVAPRRLVLPFMHLSIIIVSPTTLRTGIAGVTDFQVMPV